MDNQIPNLFSTTNLKQNDKNKSNNSSLNDIIISKKDIFDFDIKKHNSIIQPSNDVLIKTKRDKYINEQVNLDRKLKKLKMFMKIKEVDDRLQNKFQERLRQFDENHKRKIEISEMLRRKHEQEMNKNTLLNMKNENSKTNNPNKSHESKKKSLISLDIEQMNSPILKPKKHNNRSILRFSTDENENEIEIIDKNVESIINPKNRMKSQVKTNFRNSKHPYKENPNKTTHKHKEDDDVGKYEQIKNDFPTNKNARSRSSLPYIRSDKLNQSQESYAFISPKKETKRFKHDISFLTDKKYSPRNSQNLLELNIINDLNFYKQKILNRSNPDTSNIIDNHEKSTSIESLKKTYLPSLKLVKQISPTTHYGNLKQNKPYVYLANHTKIKLIHEY